MSDMSQTLSTWKQIVEEESADGFQPSRTYRGTISRSEVETESWGTQVPSSETPSLTVKPTQPTPSPWAAYEISAELGRGGMGIVYNARQTNLRREVALKKALSAAGGRRFSNEAVITGALEHPNIVTVYDLIAAPNGEIGMAMKLIRGRSWEDHLTADWHEVENLSEERLHWHLDVLYKVCQAMAFAHSQNVLHNDLKPENVMVGEYGEVALMDWGCATGMPGLKHPNPLPVLQGERILSPFGTPCCMAPEQALGHGHLLNSWTDTFLLGAMLYRIVEGRPLRTERDLTRVLERAAKADYNPMVKCGSSQIRALCTKALQAEPTKRFQTVDALLEGLAAYQKTYESEKLSKVAGAQLDSCLASIANTKHSTERALVDLGEVVYGYQQALVLWPSNPNASEGVEKARVALIDYAISQGDLKLAAAHIEQLDDSASRVCCKQNLQHAIEGREAAARQAQRNRNFLILAVSAVILVLIIGGVLVKAEQRKTETQRQLAEAHLQDLQELSDIQRVKKQFEAELTLWPSIPSNVDPMTKWIQDTEELLQKLPKHRATLRKLAQGVPVDDRDEPIFNDPTIEWEYVTLKDLISGLETLQNTELSLMERRLADASSVERITLVDAADVWEEAITSIASSKVYNGLQLEPQLGLVPIGTDPASGLWEFAHVQSGEIPTRDADGRLSLPEDPCIVLVLLPGGTFHMGAQTGTGGADGRNIDPRATAIEQPVHPVSLAPFFLAKYEVTQGQWMRIMGENPSAYPAGREVGDPEKKAITIRNPVEQVTWKDSAEAMRRLDLILPTEAQWEYGSRAGTDTIYWSGNSIESLDGTLNIADRYCEQNGGPGSWKYERSLFDGYVAHAPIGEFRANRFGLHDTAGNVWEWCLDHFGSYENPTAPDNGARLNAEEGAPRVFRGGGFRAASVHARSADRYTQYAAEYQGYDVGLRAARSVQTSVAGDP